MRSVVLYLVLFCAGFAALSWQVIWQLKLSLSLGFSSLGTAITLATTMGGMTVGTLLMGRYLRHDTARSGLPLYVLLEAVVGASGLGLGAGFKAVEVWDAQVYQLLPQFAPFVHLAAGVALLGLPTLALGATIPVMRLLSRDFNTPLSWLYGTNTAGAAAGCLVVAFELLPRFGISTTIGIVASINFSVAAAALALGSAAAPRTPNGLDEEGPRGVLSPLGTLDGWKAVCLSGFVTFALEVAWFRSLKAAFGSRTESFALMLAAVLLALALGATLGGRLAAAGEARRFPFLLVSAGLAILLATPLVERFDLLSGGATYHLSLLKRFLASLLVLGPAMVLLGACLPWLLDSRSKPLDCARLYAFNTVGAIGGSLISAWVLLPAIGFARTSWVLGVVTAVFGIRLTGRLHRPSLLALMAALLVAVGAESGVGRDRIQITWDVGRYTILDYVETSESTISVIETETGRRDLVIDGFIATGDEPEMTHYMKWMGHLPMVMHPDPKDVLLICFGTGQTANALVQEGARRVDMVDLHEDIFSLAHHFESNQGVMKSELVRPIVMDGRAWLRRTADRYDVITLEPMAPTHAGVNNLYSLEFYRLARQRMQPGGVICQWLPFHLLHPDQTLKVASTFRQAFPNCGLWLDPVGFTGLLVGVKEGPPVGTFYPGFEREVERSLTPSQVERAMVLDSAGMRRFAQNFPPVTDDNQDLAYGSLRLLSQPIERKKSALRVIHWASTDPPPAAPDYRPLLDIRVELFPKES